MLLDALEGRFVIPQKMNSGSILGVSIDVCQWGCGELLGECKRVVTSARNWSERGVFWGTQVGSKGTQKIPDTRRTTAPNLSWGGGAGLIWRQRYDVAGWASFLQEP